MEQIDLLIASRFVNSRYIYLDITFRFTNDLCLIFFDAWFASLCSDAQITMTTNESCRLNTQTLWFGSVQCDRLNKQTIHRSPYIGSFAIFFLECCYSFVCLFGIGLERLYFFLSHSLRAVFMMFFR